MYEILLLSPAQRDLDRLEAPVLARILKKIHALAEDARPPGCLKLTDEDGYRIRIGEYRALYRIDDPSKRIFVYRIKHRKDVYS